MHRSLCVLLPALACVPAARADLVAHVNTVMGNFDIQLYQDATPITVANFVSYVTSSRYNGTFIHRAIPGFVVQGGEWVYHDGDDWPHHIPTDPPILNEGVLGRPNVRGTIAAAHIEGQLDSATSSFYFNLVDNSAALDARSYVVFGSVLGNGMEVIDAIAALQIVNAGEGFTDLPVRDFTGGVIHEANLVIVNSVTIVPAPTGASMLAAGICAIAPRRRGI